MRGPQKDHQNKGEEGCQKYRTGVLTLVKGVFLPINGGQQKRARREFRRVGNQS